MAIQYFICALADNQCQFDAVGTGFTPYPVTHKMAGDFYCIQTSAMVWGWGGGAWSPGVSYTATADDGMVFAGWYTCARDYETTGDRPQNVGECNVLVTSSPTLSFDAHNDALRHWYPYPNRDYVHKIAVAKWYKPGDPTVTFDANAERGYVEPEHTRTAVRRCLLGDQIVLPGALRYPRNKWMFSGWYTLDGTRVGDAGEYYAPTADITLYAHWHTIRQHDMDIRLTPAWVTSATWSYEDYGEDIRAASGNDPGAIGMLRWRIVLPAEPKTYFESIHFGIWGDNGYIGTYPSSTLPEWDVEVCGPPPPQTMEGEFEVPYRWGDYDEVQRLAGMTVDFAYVFRQSRALLYCADRWTTPLAHNSAGNLLFGHKAYTPAEAAAPT